MDKNQSLWLDLRADDVNLCYFKHKANTILSLKYLRTTKLGLAKIKPYSKI